MEYIEAKTILSKTRNPYNWFGVDYNVNLYRGCNHGCIYCDSRSSCYGDTNFDKVKVKKDCLEILEKELAKKPDKKIVGTGGMSDPYNPFEKDFKLTKGLLQLAHKFRFGVVITTKSDLVLEDIYELLRISTHSPVVVIFTITCFDDQLCKKIEPNVALTSQRLKAIETLSKFNITTGVILMPVLPFINDTEENIKNIVNAAANAGAKFIYPSFGVTLRGNQRDYFYDKLDMLFPNIKDKYKKYYGYKYGCKSFNKRLFPTFVNECIKHQLPYKMKDIVELYKPTIKYDQLSLDGYWD